MPAAFSSKKKSAVAVSRIHEVVICALGLVCALGLSACGGGHGSSTPDAGTGAEPPADGAQPMDDGAAPSSDGSDAGSDGPRPCAPPPSIDMPAATLAATGCMDGVQPTKFASVVVPYEVNSPLWSDGADKQRGFVLPPGGKIHVKDCTVDTCPVGPADDGKWAFPVGTVMVKSFGFDGKLVETRLFVHLDDATWVGYGYAWNEAQTAATIVPPEGLEVTFDTGARQVDWHYPSRDNCMSCHFSTAGYTLGPETKQLNRTVGGQNQIDALAARAVFEQAPLAPYAAPLAIPYAGSAGQPSPTATIDERARSYLHANCSFCHRPDGNFPNFDLRYGVALADTSTCGVDPERGTLNVAGAKILTPASPSTSTLWLRMQTLDPTLRMPNIASFVADQDALTLVGDWISSIAACP
jgi:uncharacterized repeat protein (TIGR03806 family)